MNNKRRKFLKYALLGLGALPLLKFFGAGFLKDNSQQVKAQTPKREAKEVELPSGKGFHIVETGDKIEFYNEADKKVFSIDKEGGIQVG